MVSPGRGVAGQGFHVPKYIMWGYTGREIHILFNLGQVAFCMLMIITHHSSTRLQLSFLPSGFPAEQTPLFTLLRGRFQDISPAGSTIYTDQRNEFVMVEYIVGLVSRAKFGHDRWAQYRSPRARIKKNSSNFRFWQFFALQRRKIYGNETWHWRAHHMLTLVCQIWPWSVEGLVLKPSNIPKSAPHAWRSAPMLMKFHVEEHASGSLSRSKFPADG